MTTESKPKGSTIGKGDVFFLRSAIGYYAAGRYAVFAQLPVSGNVLHHAVEMFLKAGLSRTLELDALKKFGHKLPALWTEHRRAFPSTPDEPWTSVVDALDDFEELRYPDSILKYGAEIRIGRGQRPAVEYTTTPQPEKRYVLWLGEIDRLIAIIIEHSPFNPKFILTYILHHEGRAVLLRENDEQWVKDEDGSAVPDAPIG